MNACQQNLVGYKQGLIVNQQIASVKAQHKLIYVNSGDTVGLRLGHGVRVETRATRIWYCTAG